MLKVFGESYCSVKKERNVYGARASLWEHAVCRSSPSCSVAGSNGEQLQESVVAG